MKKVLIFIILVLVLVLSVFFVKKIDKKEVSKISDEKNVKKMEKANTVLAKEELKKRELDNYIKKAKNLTKLQKREEAYVYYKKAEDLNIKLPKDFYYYYGYAIFRLKAHTFSKKASWKEAKEAFQTYLTTTGEKGEHFKDAVMGLHFMKEAEWLEDGCNKDKLLNYCVKLSSFLAGEVKEKHLYKLCKEMKDASSCKKLKRYYYKSGLDYYISKKYDEALKVYQKGCKFGSKKCCNFVEIVEYDLKDIKNK